jgi:hydroxymethylpyrimidine pyrophosphatase-like HAD family hydrolase
MVVTDLDGTLLDSGGALSAANRSTLEALGAAGVLRVVATGRNLHSALRAMPLELPLDFLVFGSGAGILDWPTQRLLHASHLGEAEALGAAQHLRERELHFMLHAGVPHNHRFWYHRAGPGNADFERRLGRYRGHCEPWPEVDPAGPFSQLLVVEPAGNAARHRELVCALHPLNVVRTTSPLDHRSHWFEVFAQGVSKASGARWLLERRRLHAQRVLAIGNDFNDEELLDWAPAARVVANAPRELRERFAEVASNDEDGFSEAVHAWLAALG